MNLKKRIQSIFSGRLERVLEELEDNEALARGALRDMTRQIAERESHIIAMKQHRATLKKSLSSHRHEFDSMVKQLQEGVSGDGAEREKLAQRALLRKKQIDAVELQGEQIDADVTNQECALLHLQQRLHQMAHRTHNLGARGATGVGSNESDVAADENLRRWERKVRAQELYRAVQFGVGGGDVVDPHEVQLFLRSIEKN